MVVLQLAVDVLIPAMRVAIVGSRTITDFDLIEMSVAESGFDITEVISGGAKGIDVLAIEWAKKYDIPFKTFSANWNDLTHPDALIKTTKWGQKYDARAGLRRNEVMSVYAEAVIAIWNGKSTGTKHMLAMASKRDLLTFVYRTDLPYKTGHIKRESKREFYARLINLTNDNTW